jgi:hypothetical protein
LEFRTRQTILRIAEIFPGEKLNRAVWTEYLPHEMHALYLPHSSDGFHAIEIELLCKVRYCLEATDSTSKQQRWLRGKWTWERTCGARATQTL